MRNGIFKLLTLLFPFMPYAKADTTTQYVWNQHGISVYASPSTSTDVIHNLPFGSEVTLIEQQPIAEERVLFHPDEQQEAAEMECDTYRHLSKWLLVSYGTGKGYIRDTYVSNMPIAADTSPFLLMHEYLPTLSDIVRERHQGRTDDFCRYDEYAFANGTTYSETDLGPCEQCGVAVSELYLPNIGMHQALLLVAYFHHFPIDDGGQRGNDPEDYTSICMAHTQPDTLKLEIFHSYGQFREITISEQGNGVLIENYTSM